MQSLKDMVLTNEAIDGLYAQMAKTIDSIIRQKRKLDQIKKSKYVYSLMSHGKR